MEPGVWNLELVASRALSVRIYLAARGYAQQRGIIIADTKFEFGYYQGSLILIDEVLTPDAPLLDVDLPGIKKVKSGKVREMFDLGDCFLMVATDRISAFDCIMPNGIPRKGEVLTQLSHFWFDQLKTIVANHRLALAEDPLPPPLKSYESKLARRTMIVKKAQPLPVECVVRGYLAGSGWKEYQQSQTVCGMHLPAGLVEASELPRTERADLPGRARLCSAARHHHRRHEI